MPWIDEEDDDEWEKEKERRRRQSQRSKPGKKGIDGIAAAQVFRKILADLGIPIMTREQQDAYDKKNTPK